jgi:hypothetical protein
METIIIVVVVSQVLGLLAVLVQNLFSETYEYIWTVGRTPWTGDRHDARPLN